MTLLNFPNHQAQRHFVANLELQDVSSYSANADRAILLQALSILDGSSYTSFTYDCHPLPVPYLILNQGELSQQIEAIKMCKCLLRRYDLFRCT